mmetsp:Transcript_17459/g.52381  ORF Transcript_17459/g.52381 Transcript_17459/m.52381 type:complete len:268 (+) Transcript_17459:419-1222(+)
MVALVAMCGSATVTTAVPATTTTTTTTTASSFTEPRSSILVCSCSFVVCGGLLPSVFSHRRQICRSISLSRKGAFVRQIRMLLSWRGVMKLADPAAAVKVLPGGLRGGTIRRGSLCVGRSLASSSAACFLAPRPFRCIRPRLAIGSLWCGRSLRTRFIPYRIRLVGCSGHVQRQIRRRRSRAAAAAPEAAKGCPIAADGIQDALAVGRDQLPGVLQMMPVVNRNDGQARRDYQHSSHPAQASRCAATAASATARRAVPSAAAVRLPV